MSGSNGRRPREVGGGEREVSPEGRLFGVVVAWLLMGVVFGTLLGVWIRWFWLEWVFVNMIGR